MSERTIYVFKGDATWAANVLESLKQGEARFGWSYEKTADLRELRHRIEKSGWGSLTKAEQDCYHDFLLDIAVDDYVVYVNVPTWGLCTLARITRPYYWQWSGDDFNHRLGVDPASVKTFDRNDKIVHPALSQRLKLQGRWWRIYAKQEFALLLARIEAGPSGKPSTPADKLEFLATGIEPLLLQITGQIHHTHPNYDLEHFVAEVLKCVPGVKDVRLQGGAGDRGADIVMTIEQGHPLTGIKQTFCVVQVKSFQGEHWDTKAVEDIEHAFEAYPQAEVGLIFSTAVKPGPTLELALEKLREKTGKTINLFIGPEFALFVMRYASHLLTKSRIAPAPAA